MLKRFIGFVAGFALAIGEAAQIDRVLNRQRFKCGGWTRRIGQDGVADVAIVRNHLARVANVLTIMTAETT